MLNSFQIDMTNPGHRISYETANTLANVWPSAETLEHAMELAGIKTKDRRAQQRIRRAAEEMLGITLASKRPTLQASQNFSPTVEHYHLDHPYTAVIFSDAHFWPGETSDAFFILLEIIKELQPELVIDNGDSWDGASISRFPKQTFLKIPTLKEELDSVHEHLDLIVEAAGEADLFRNIGNHDLRFEALLAQRVPEIEGFAGTKASELFPGWKHQYCLILQNCVEVRHRMRSGIHAAWNNTVNAGISIVTGHTHRLTIREMTDRRGTRYGIETGTIANSHGPQFHYMEDSVRNWQEGFIVLTVIPDENGVRVCPEKVEVTNGKAFFRGRMYG